MMPAAARQSLVVIGNGMAGMRTVEELLQLAPELYDITVFGAEPHGNYNRILLSPVLAGDKQMDDIMIHNRAWYGENGITLYAGDPVLHIDRRRRMVRAKSGREVWYDRLLIATGSNPFIIPVPGHKLPGVIGFRDIDDVDKMLDAARRGGHAVVIGGGLLGLEAANGLHRRGMDVTVVHSTDSLMNMQLDKPASLLLKQALEAKGLRFMLDAHTTEIMGDKSVTGVRFRDGTQRRAELVVMAAGVRPNIALAQQAGLHCERAIVGDDTLQTYDPRVYAVGECVQHRSAIFGLVAPLWEQARVCGAHLAQKGHRRYVQSATPTKLKVTGVELYSVGDFCSGAADPGFIAAHTSGLDAALASADIDLAEVATRCKLDPADLLRFYQLFAAHDKVVTAFSQGVNQSSSGTDKVNAIINCHLLTGRIGKPGMGPFSLTGQPNAMGGREVGGLANMLAAHMELANPAHRETVQSFWDSPQVASEPGLKALDLFHAIEAGTVKAVWIMATNPMVSLPDQFGAPPIAPARLPAGARRGARRLAHHLRRGHAHGFCRL